MAEPPLPVQTDWLGSTSATDPATRSVNPDGLDTKLTLLDIY